MKIEFGDEATESLVTMLSAMSGWLFSVTYARGVIRITEDLIYRGSSFDGRDSMLRFKFDLVDEESRAKGEVIWLYESDIENIYVY